MCLRSLFSSPIPSIQYSRAHPHWATRTPCMSILILVLILTLIFLGQLCPMGKGAMRLSLCSTNWRATLRVVTARVCYIPSGSLMSHRTNYEELWDTGPMVYRPYPYHPHALHIFCTFILRSPWIFKIGSWKVLEFLTVTLLNISFIFLFLFN